MRTNAERETLDAVVDQLVAAIELRECGDPDGWDWTMERQIRRLERELLEHHRHASRPAPASAPDHVGYAEPAFAGPRI